MAPWHHAELGVRWDGAAMRRVLGKCYELYKKSQSLLLPAPVLLRKPSVSIFLWRAKHEGGMAFALFEAWLGSVLPPGSATWRSLP